MLQSYSINARQQQILPAQSIQGAGTDELTSAYNLPMQTGASSLPYGIYFGDNQVRHELPGFSVSLLTPAFRAEDIPLHGHEHASFVCVLSGAYLSSADGAARVSRSPTLIFNPAGTVHRDTFVLADGRFLAVSISDQSLGVALNWAALPTSAVASVSRHRVTMARRLAEECAVPGPANSSTMEAMCWELLSTLSGVALWPNNHRASPPAWIGRARELLHDRCSDALLITEMAQQLGVHPVYFARAFRDQFRCTPGEYRMRCRLRDALADMHKVNVPLSEIALNAGFFDQSHFSTAFRKHFGMPPQAYRKQLTDTL
jgi:AraC family transcriptional regulator